MARSFAGLIASFADMSFLQGRQGPHQRPNRPRHRLGLTGAFVVWLIVFAGMVAYLAAH